MYVHTCMHACTQIGPILGRLEPLRVIVAALPLAALELCRSQGMAPKAKRKSAPPREKPKARGCGWVDRRARALSLRDVTSVRTHVAQVRPPECPVVVCRTLRREAPQPCTQGRRSAADVHNLRMSYYMKSKAKALPTLPRFGKVGYI